MDKINLYQPVLPVQPGHTAKSSKNQKPKTPPDFKEVLQRQLIPEKIKFSGHSLKRLKQNHIQLSPQQLDKLTGAIEKAELKGAKESFVLMDDLAFVVSVKNKTVITVVDGQRIKDNVFTNIDSAVIV